MQTAKTLIRLGECLRLYESLLGLILHIRQLQGCRRTDKLHVFDYDKEITLLFFIFAFTNFRDSEMYFCCCLLGLRRYVPVNNFSVMSGRSHRFLCITSTFWEVNASCSSIQHGDLSADRTPELAPESDALPLGHRASLVKCVLRIPGL